jgi:hypothetical protein
MFEVTRPKHVPATVAGDFRCKVWIVKAHIHGNAETRLLEAVCSMRSTGGHLKKGLQSREIDQQIKMRISTDSRKTEAEANSKSYQCR